MTIIVTTSRFFHIYAEVVKLVDTRASGAREGNFVGVQVLSSAPKSIANQKISVFAKPTGKTVGEPNNDWIIDNFSSNRIGEINFPEAGFYEIEMQIIPSRNDNLKFQWIWAE